MYVCMYACMYVDEYVCRFVDEYQENDDDRWMDVLTYLQVCFRLIDCMIELGSPGSSGICPEMTGCIHSVDSVLETNDAMMQANLLLL